MPNNVFLYSASVHLDHVMFKAWHIIMRANVLAADITKVLVFVCRLPIDLYRLCHISLHWYRGLFYISS